MKKFIFISIYFICVLQYAFTNSINLTEEELNYIASRGPVRAVSADGTGPIQYTDSKGNIKGIAVGMLDEISKITQLTFDIKLYEELTQVGKAYQDGTDIIFGIPDQYTREGYSVSEPLLQSTTILFANINTDIKDLEHKIFAATYGSDLPEGVNEEKVIIYNSREDAIKAVNSGAADFGYGNAYSVAFYTLQHGLNNIYTVPHGKEARLYRILFIQDDPLLESIINKAIQSIDTYQKQNIILSSTSQIERILTPALIIKTYGVKIVIGSLIIIFLLIIAIIFIASSHSKLNFQKQKYAILAEVSNEYIFEYDSATSTLSLGEKFHSLVNTSSCYDEVQNAITSTLSDFSDSDDGKIISLDSPSGKQICFKVIATKVPIDKTKGIWIGKLVDISEEIDKHNYLETLAQEDGLTRLLNAVTAREKIEHRLLLKRNEEKDMFIIFDIDDFKLINDTKGHLGGDEVLQSIGEILIQTKRSDKDIIGRIGGDEFCIYLENLPSIEEGCTYCTSLIGSLREEGISVSMGASSVNDDSIDELYQKVDNVMYKAKNSGKNRVEFDRLQT